MSKYCVQVLYISGALCPEPRDPHGFMEPLNGHNRTILTPDNVRLICFGCEVNSHCFNDLLPLIPNFLYL